MPFHPSPAPHPHLQEFFLLARGVLHGVPKQCSTTGLSSLSSPPPQELEGEVKVKSEA